MSAVNRAAVRPVTATATLTAGPWRLRRSAALLAAAMWVAAAHAQTPNLAGTWALDAARSNIVATAAYTGLIAAGAPKTLHITQPANGSVVVESQINEAHVRLYKPGAQTSTPAGQGGVVVMTAKWEGGSLVSEGAMKAPNGDATTIREMLAVAPDGKTLTVTITAAAKDKAESTLVYARTADVGPCERWPTPCKRAPQ
jgi:hypothetical protein